MKILTASKTNDGWKKRFALFPTLIGKDKDGNKIWVWLQTYESKFNSHFGDGRTPPFCYYMLRRLPNQEPYELLMISG